MTKNHISYLVIGMLFIFVILSFTGGFEIISLNIFQGFGLLLFSTLDFYLRMIKYQKSKNYKVFFDRTGVTIRFIPFAFWPLGLIGAYVFLFHY